MYALLYLTSHTKRNNVLTEPGPRPVGPYQKTIRHKFYTTLSYGFQCRLFRHSNQTSNLDYSKMYPDENIFVESAETTSWGRLSHTSITLLVKKINLFSILIWTYTQKIDSNSLNINIKQFVPSDWSQNSSQHTSDIATLHSDTQPLHQELEWPRLSCHRHDLVSEVVEKVRRLFIRPAHQVTQLPLARSCIEPTVRDTSPLSDVQPRSPQRRQIARNGTSDWLPKCLDMWNPRSCNDR